MSHKLDQIHKLLAMANRHPDTPEGQSARKIATQRLEELGLTEADITIGERKLLDRRRQVWDAALLDVVSSAYPIELRQHIDTLEGTDDLQVHGPSRVLDRVEFRFVHLRRHLLKCSGDYHRSIVRLVHPTKINDFIDVYLNYAVIAIAERMLDEQQANEKAAEVIVEPWAKSHHGATSHSAKSHSASSPSDSSHSAKSHTEHTGSDQGREVDQEGDDLLDRLINAADRDVPHELPTVLDPALAGYKAGEEAPFTEGISDKETQATPSAPRGALTQDVTQGIDNPIEGWDELE